MYREAGWDRRPEWEPSAGFIARLVLIVCVVPPAAGLAVTMLIAGLP
jgi:hypothetical protein